MEKKIWYARKIRYFFYILEIWYLNDFLLLVKFAHTHLEGVHPSNFSRPGYGTLFVPGGVVDLRAAAHVSNVCPSCVWSSHLVHILFTSGFVLGGPCCLSDQ